MSDPETGPSGSSPRAGSHAVSNAGSHAVAKPGAGKLGIRIAAVVILLGAAVVLFDAIRVSINGGFGPQQPGFFPMIVGIGLVGFGLAFLIRATLKPDHALEEQAAAEHKDTHWRTLWVVVVALVIYAALLDPVGYIIATSVFFVGIAWLAGSRKIIRDVIIAVLFSAAVYFGFTELLGVRLPGGLLETVL
ncbi:tripartite tricarboxylate transporter TctB family protein [Arthrobacter tumbae]|uniref:tripartite tricarboxylate transporter TctB family protein n=1 Tax=Arthrobacter tumbae TaxID=163874 RepID=UPI00195D2884|nr:tripartite tricarboxylate transporter TctB family protein [Arthrobacter tumbae]MBM7782273.1 putative tricarboxylic transport membrane protein [Arthrobacter tumbae]